MATWVRCSSDWFFDSLSILTIRSSCRSAILIGTPIVIGATAYYFWPASDSKVAASSSTSAEAKKIVKTAKIKPNTRNSIKGDSLNPEPVVKLPPQVEAKNQGNVCFKV